MISSPALTSLMLYGKSDSPIILTYDSRYFQPETAITGKKKYVNQHNINCMRNYVQFNDILVNE